MPIFSNNAESTLTIALTDTDVQMTLADASKFNDDADNIDSQIATIVSGSNVEIVEVTNILGNVLTIVREAEDTTALAFPVGAEVFAGVTAGILEDIHDNVDALLNNALSVDIDIAANTANITALSSQVTLPIIQASGDPSTVPQHLHQWYRDSTTYAMWRSTGTANTTDWDKYVTTNRYLRYDQTPSSLHSSIPLGRINIRDNKIEFKTRTTDGNYIILSEGFHGGAKINDILLGEDNPTRNNILMQGNYVATKCDSYESLNNDIVFVNPTGFGIYAHRLIIKYATDNGGLGLTPVYKTATSTGATPTTRTPVGTPPLLGETGILEVIFYDSKVTMKWLDGVQ